MNLAPFYLDDVIKRALQEDIGYFDVTTDSLIDESKRCEAVLLAKQEGVLCGIEAATRVFELLDEDFEARLFKKDGDLLESGQRIAVLSGKTRALLHGERTALNLLQHLSGIATATHRASALIAHTKARVTDTRKTLPGLRALQKYAVVVGGGKNHRFGLSDAAMIKDNHIDACGSIARAVEALRAKAGHMVKIEVEARTIEEALQALYVGADVIMFDNMSCEDMKKAVELVAGRALLEASGNITEETIARVAETGVDFISMGALTHSVRALDISMKIRVS
ncbi:MAG: carboxylating nicotinate-nucleotide diphosphorylase [Clostridia bacterium]|nr:carboxylating nicotinate-nucleotide diphosphorylase [Clostridia bacterium]